MADQPGSTPSQGAERIATLLSAFTRLTGMRVRLSVERDGRTSVLFDGLEQGGPVDGSVRSETWPVQGDVQARIEFAADPDADDGHRTGELLRESLLPLLSSETELQFFASELAARFEEVELLTSVSDTLGSMVGLEHAATRLLESTATVLGADEAEIWVSDTEGLQLARLAAIGPASGRSSGHAEIRDVNSDPSPTARAFREGRSDTGIDRRGTSDPDVPWLLVPLRHTALHGTAGSVGALKLRGAPGRQPFRPRDVRVASAVGSHLAAAIENQRLLHDNVERERMLVELALAHDLQLKLLPEPGDFDDLADIAARCDPADSVGGDFYHLLRLPGDRLGVMLGDVSSHGYSAGLIMALTMSAASLVAREHDDPAQALSGIHRELVRKLESTEMYMTVCYAVLDPAGGLLRYANAGHPHAWRIREGDTERLEALNPPLGIAEFDRYVSREIPWETGPDTLLLFTDGLSESLRSDRMWSDDVLTAMVRQATSATASELLDRIFELAEVPDGVAVDDRTAVVVK